MADAEKEQESKPERETPVIVPRCRACRLPIEVGAAVCHHCHRPQGKLRSILEFTTLLNALVATGVLILGSCQYQAARRDRSEAAEALRRVDAAMARIEQLSTAQTGLSHDVNEAFARAFGDTCRVFKGVYDFGALVCTLPDGTRLKYTPAVRE